MNNINKQLKQVFDANFEELSVTDERVPEITIYGKGYTPKWKQHTMTMFLNDLNDLVQGLDDKITEHEVTKDEKIESLETQIEDLEAELKEAKEQS